MNNNETQGGLHKSVINWVVGILEKPLANPYK